MKTSKTLKHALVIGGSGMLKDVSLWLANQGYLTSVIGRNYKKLAKLAEENSLISPITVDYNLAQELKNEISGCIENNGRIELVIAWIHDDYQTVLDNVANEIESKSKNAWQLYHVIGSSTKLERIKNKPWSAYNCSYNYIQLGFKIENSISRWLTHSEIGQGVIDSIKTSKNLLIGQLEPWELKP